MLRLYTRTGDDGSTGLIGAERVSKSDPRVAAYGDVDEINAAVGFALAACGDGPICDMLRTIQADLFVIGAELATPPPGNVGLKSAAPAGMVPHPIERAAVERLEKWIDRATAEVAPLRNFVLPGGSEEAARLHMVRTACRRAERAVVILASQTEVRGEVLAYLNRLSDLFFALARAANQRAGVADIIWPPPAQPTDTAKT